MGKFAGQLDQDGANPTTGADDQQALSFTTVLLNAQSIEQQLPGSNGGQRQGCGTGIVQATWFLADDALIHQVKFAVATRAIDRAGVKYFVASFEQ
ncbi:hypothetical protein D3C79_967230 [compost metagenome]